MGWIICTHNYAIKYMTIAAVNLPVFISLSCTQSCHVRSLVMYAVLSCTQFCHVHSLVMYTVLSCTQSCHVHSLVIYTVLSYTQSCHVHSLDLKNDALSKYERPSVWPTVVQP